jgi:hypothetical protein
MSERRRVRVALLVLATALLIGLILAFTHIMRPNVREDINVANTKTISSIYANNTAVQATVNMQQTRVSTIQPH